MPASSTQGPYGPTPFQEIALQEWNTVLSVNLTGTMLCCRRLARHVRAGFWPRCSCRVHCGRALPKIAGTAYVASKAALAALPLAGLTYAAHSITVNVVAPGRIARRWPVRVTARSIAQQLPAFRGPPGGA
ncbi:SDR family NAD(P)-dependent oxidoreductase (plasmid) [Sinorhizobium meliloti]|nr:SDR family NAD(P)-dependent oxidoreductase [Sinorhizobium meliloti]